MGKRDKEEKRKRGGDDSSDDDGNSVDIDNAAIALVLENLFALGCTRPEIGGMFGELGNESFWVESHFYY